MVIETEHEEFPHTVMLSLLGGIIQVRCKHSFFAQQLTDYLSSHVSPIFFSPDVIVDCDLEDIDRYLFRSRPVEESGSLKGVKVSLPGQQAKSEWFFSDPPIPPFVMPPFKDRFIGLHGAALETPTGGGILLLGKRGAGKSTMAVELVNNHQCKLLTDETIFLHRRTSLVEPFQRPLKMWEKTADGLRPHLVAATKACQNIAHRPVLATHVVFLELQEKVEPGFIPLSETDAAKLFLNHHLDVGSSSDESIVTILQLAHNLPAALCRYRSYEERMFFIQTIEVFYQQ